MLLATLCMLPDGGMWSRPGDFPPKRELPAVGCDTLSGRRYLYFERLGVGIAGFSALAAERTSSFVYTAKRNGCDSRK